MLPFLGMNGIIQMDIQEYEISNHHNSNPQSCFQPLGQHWGRECFVSHRDDGRDMPGPQPATASAKRPIPQLKTQKKHYHLSVASQLWKTHGKSRVYPPSDLWNISDPRISVKSETLGEKKNVRNDDGPWGFGRLILNQKQCMLSKLGPNSAKSLVCVCHLREDASVTYSMRNDPRLALITLFWVACAWEKGSSGNWWWTICNCLHSCHQYIDQNMLWPCGKEQGNILQFIAWNYNYYAHISASKQQCFTLIGHPFEISLGQTHPREKWWKYLTILNHLPTTWNILDRNHNPPAATSSLPWMLGGKRKEKSEICANKTNKL